MHASAGTSPSSEIASSTSSCSLFGGGVGTWGVAVPLLDGWLLHGAGRLLLVHHQRAMMTSVGARNNLDFKRNFDVCQPVLGLQDDADIVYVTTMIHGTDDKAWVAAVDLSKELLGVTTFPDPRASTLLSRTAGYPII